MEEEKRNRMQLFQEELPNRVEEIVREVRNENWELEKNEVKLEYEKVKQTLENMLVDEYRWDGNMANQFITYIMDDSYMEMNTIFSNGHKMTEADVIQVKQIVRREAEELENQEEELADQMRSFSTNVPNKLYGVLDQLKAAGTTYPLIDDQIQTKTSYELRKEISVRSPLSYENISIDVKRILSQFSQNLQNVYRSFRIKEQEESIDKIQQEIEYTVNQYTLEQEYVNEKGKKSKANLFRADQTNEIPKIEQESKQGSVSSSEPRRSFADLFRADKPVQAEQSKEQIIASIQEKKEEVEKLEKQIEEQEIEDLPSNVIF